MPQKQSSSVLENNTCASAKPTAASSLQTWLQYLEHLHTSAIDLGLDRVKAVGVNAGLLNPAPKVITVAGTNGKGSTCAMLEAILMDAGYCVGVYSSPHLVRYNERVRINGKELEDADHAGAFNEVEAARGAISLSLFEFGTLAALSLFKSNNVDVVILEVGLGGRLDATNIVDSDVAVITSLAVDHVDWLGDDIEKIGFEKAGIFRSGRPAVCGQPTPPASVAAHADDIGAELYQVGYQFTYEQEGEHWDWHSGTFDLPNLPVPSLPLPNAATAVMVLGLVGLDISDENIVRGLKNVRLAGRMEKVSEKPEVILDVAHNPHSAAYLAEQLRRRVNGSGKQNVHAVIAMLHDKDIGGTIKALKPVVDSWYPASLVGPRAANASELAGFLPEGTASFDTPEAAFDAAVSQAGEADIVIVCGSFYTVGQVSNYLKVQKNRGE